MKKIALPDWRALCFRWFEAEQCFRFVALYKDRKLHNSVTLTPFDFYELCFGKLIFRHDPMRPYDKPYTLALQKRDDKLDIITSAQFHYEIIPRFETRWPMIDFADFYRAAKAERGCKPETGWHLESLAEALATVDQFTDQIVKSFRTPDPNDEFSGIGDWSG